MPTEAEHDRDRLRARRRTLCALIETFNLDETRALEFVALRLFKGRERYGPLDLAKDARDWTAEMAEERADFLLYQAFHELAEQAARIEAIEMLPEDLIEPREDNG